jgi:hypothetical protein
LFILARGFGSEICSHGYVGLCDVLIFFSGAYSDILCSVVLCSLGLGNGTLGLHTLVPENTLVISPNS